MKAGDICTLFFHRFLGIFELGTTSNPLSERDLVSIFAHFSDVYEICIVIDAVDIF